MVTLFLLILAGFVLLIAGADFIVKSSVAMANKLKIPPLIVGLTVVAFGTSAPEFVVSLTSALEGAEGLVLGNVVGSNTANILLILGSSALIFPIYVNRRAFFRDYGFLLLVTLVFVCFALTGVFVFWMGIVMLLMLAAFIVLNYLSAKNKAGGEYVSAWDHKSWPFVIVAAVLGLAAIVYGADLLVDGAVGIAKALGVSEEIIGLTVIAVGTSLPELATSCVAAWRKQSDLWSACCPKPAADSLPPAHGPGPSRWQRGSAGGQRPHSGAPEISSSVRLLLRRGLPWCGHGRSPDWRR